MASATVTFPRQRRHPHDAGTRGGMASEAEVRRRPDSVALRQTFTRITLAAFICALTGCSDGVSESDVQFVTGAMPSQFQSLRMYHTAPENAAPFGSSAHGPVRLQQGCEAVLLVAGSQKRETVILESQTAASFDLDAIRTADGWTVTSDGLSPPSDNPVAFRTQFTNCVSAIEDKYRSEPEKAPFSGPTLSN